MRRLHYHLVDVFTDRMFGGNQLAVFVDGRGLSSETMQALAKEMNLSESTFVLPVDTPGHDYKVRIFTPGAELPMAGHPTVGTSFVLAKTGMVRQQGALTKIVLEEKVGPIPVDINFEAGRPAFIWMTQPAPKFGPRFENRAGVAGMLSLPLEAIDASLPVEVVSCGVPFLFVPLTDLRSVQSIKLRTDVWARLLEGFPAREVLVFTRQTENAGSTVHSRMFAPSIGLMEDPATGGASGPLGCYMVRYGLAEASPLARIVSEQGIEMGRPSFIHIDVERQGEQISSVRVGGQCVYVGEGDVELSI